MPTLSTNPHDHFFKAVFSRPEVASDFLRGYLPEKVFTLLDLSTLVIHKDTFVDQDLAEHYSDLLYQIDLKDGQAGYVYVLFEHKSYSEPLIGLDLLR